MLRGTCDTDKLKEIYDALHIVIYSLFFFFALSSGYLQHVMQCLRLALASKWLVDTLIVALCATLHV